jgi:hypothetical protein
MAPNLRFKKEFNLKIFLAPSAIESMAAAHAKIYPGERNQYQLRISDCNSAIKLWGDIKTQRDKEVAIEKLQSLIDIASMLQHQIKIQLK